MKAIHNVARAQIQNILVVLYPKDTEKWKQFTTLKEEGFEFETKFVENKTTYGTERDFVYFWKNQKDGRLETTFFFKWYDADGIEYTVDIEAKNFDVACDIFLMQPPIFLEEIFNEVHTKVGCIFILTERKEFKQFKIKK